MRILLPLILLGGLAGAHAARGPATAVLARYIAAVGGEEALRNVETRVTEGEFNNKRGLGGELADFARDADLTPPLHLFDSCPAAIVETSGDRAVVFCDGSEGTRLRFHFSTRDGLLVQQDIESHAGRAPMTVSYEGYRVVDGVRLPFTTRITLPNATIVYAAHSIRHNVPVDRQVFQRPQGD